MTRSERIVRDSKTDQFALPTGWFFYKITDSKYLNATLTEVRNHWTVGDIHDAWRRIDLYERIEEANRPKPKSKR